MENTVNFVYAITKPMDTVQEDTFTTAEQAQEVYKQSRRCMKTSITLEPMNTCWKATTAM